LCLLRSHAEKVRKEEEEEKEERKRKAEADKLWEDKRDTRVADWRNFMQGGTSGKRMLEH
jgi:DnaJ family protein C protein 8